MWWNGNTYPIQSITPVEGHSLMLEADGLVVMVACSHRDRAELEELAPAELFLEIRRQAGEG